MLFKQPTNFFLNSVNSFGGFDDQFKIVSEECWKFTTCYFWQKK